MKKSVWGIITLAVLVGIAVLSCPDGPTHKEKLSSVINSAMQQKMNETTQEYSALVSIIGSSITNYAVDLMLENNLRVENYFVCSIGYLTLDGEEKICSVGCFGHIFCTSTEDIKDALDE